MTARVTGVESTLRTFGKMTTKVAGTVQDQITAGLGLIYRRSQVLVPVETAALKRSGTISVSGKGLNTKGSVSYGGPTAPYALWVHEDLTKYHKPPTTARYLAKAVHDMRTRSAVERRLGGRVSRMGVNRFINGFKVSNRWY